MQFRQEQKAYWRLMDFCEKAVFVLLVIVFCLYVAGVTEAHIKLSEIHNYWHLSLSEYIEQTNQTTGWSWIKHLKKSDYLNFLPVALFASITFICYLRILPIYIGEKDWCYVLIIILQLIVLALAALRC